VRLKGYGMSLKRSVRATLPAALKRPRHIDLLETLHIFGVRADYMEQFRKFLEDEGLPANEERIEFILPVIRNLGTKPLKTIRLKKEINGVKTEFGDAFRKLGPVPTLQPPRPDLEPATAYLQKNQVVLNWYPKIQAMKSDGVSGSEDEGAPNEAHLTKQHIAFLDLDQLYFDLERFKAERGWHNLNLPRSGIAALLMDTSWYRLLIPASELAFDSFEKVRVWQEIAQALLRKYVERYYTFRKKEWELAAPGVPDLTEDDPNFPSILSEDGAEYGYRILIEESQQEIVAKLKELKEAIEQGNLKDWEFRGLKAIWFGRHLYQPLLFLDGSVVEISPAPLNKGERRFIEDLKAFHDANPGYFSERELYLLRNLSKGRGVGFFEAGNFHPDFIIWQLEGKRQRVTFVDPKGIRNVGLQDPKISFYETVKDIEKRLGQPDVVLESFIVSNTPSHEMSKLWGITKGEMQKKHILFQEEDRETYIRELLEPTRSMEVSASS
jgi:hypothetical protein